MDEFDEQLCQDVLDAIENDRRIVVAGLEITGSAETVILSGAVQSDADRALAEKIARSVPGVMSVRNNLQVRSTEGIGLDDSVVRAVRESISVEPELLSEDIRIFLEEGRLVLEGTVSDIRKKDAVARLARQAGIGRFSLRIAEVARRNIVDEVLALNVLRDLDRHQRIDVNSIDVSVGKGTVTLSGKVASYAIKAAAYETALTTSGVTEVRDRLEVESPF